MSFLSLLKAMGRKPADRKRKKLSKELGKMSVLDLSCQNLSDIDCKNLLFALETNTSLITLNLSDNAIGVNALPEVMWGLASVISGHPNLVHLNLANNQISEKDIQRLAAALGVAEKSKLDYLQLEGNMLSHNALLTLFEVISNYDYRILPPTFLGENFLHGKTIEIGAQLEEAFRENKENVKKREIREPVLILLREMGNNPTGEHRRALVEILSKITNLDLSYEKLTAEQIFNLAKALESNTSIKNLNLAGNQFGELDEFGDMTIKHTMAILSLAKMIKRNGSLTDLNLKHNNINDEGLALLADALKQNRVLFSFSLNRNVFTKEGLLTLLSVIANATHRVFPCSFLGISLLAQFPGVRENYFHGVYKKNESCVRRRVQEESGVQEDIDDCLLSAADLIQTLRDEAMEVGQTPGITTVRETPGSRCVETKYEWSQTTYHTRPKVDRKYKG